ncbi:MAG TPA: GEVED domain-containing protein [Bacteroidales bacterium]|nr:GEVED domain-containing protein [Bacteroidales bacterium]HSA42527.1 GEVED domain-containing protein [Bacteroidales bacterium]
MKRIFMDVVLLASCLLSAMPFAPLSANDLGVVALLSPLSSTGLGPNELITVRIRNFGVNDQVNFPVSYQLDAGTPIIETCVFLVPAGDSLDYTFASPGDFSAWGPHALLCCTALAGDQQPGNDCGSYTVTKVLPVYSDTLRPAPYPYWTGTTTINSLTEQGLIRTQPAGSMVREAGWAKFDLSGLQANTPFTQMKLAYYVEAVTGAPDLMITGAGVDPLLTPPGQLMQAITSGTDYLHIPCGYSPGWHVFDLPPQALNDLQASVTQEWFTLGWKEITACTACNAISIGGWNSGAHQPCLVVSFNHIPCPNDAGIAGLVQPLSGSGLGSNEPVAVAVQNFGTGPLANIPLSYQITGSPVVNEIIPLSLAAGASLIYTFTQTANLMPYGTYSLQVCTKLPGDCFPYNDCNTYHITHSLPLISDTLRPFSIPHWTGSTDGFTFTQQSRIRLRPDTAALPLEAGYAKFTVNIPPGANIREAALHFYTDSSGGVPSYAITGLNTDPLSGSPSQVMNQIVNGTGYLQFTGATGTGWRVFQLPDQAMADISTGSINNWFALGFHLKNPCVSCAFMDIDGWNEAHPPYIVVKYLTPFAHDVSVVSIESDPILAAGSNYVRAVIRNNGMNTETLNVTCTASGGYSNTLNIQLGVGLSTSLLFTGWNAVAGNAQVTVNAQLPTDGYQPDNIMTKAVAVEAGLTTAYAYNNHDPSGQLPEGPVRFYLEHPEFVTSITSAGLNGTVGGGCWANGIWYVTENFPGNSNLITIDPLSGSTVMIGSLGAAVSDLTWDDHSGTLIALVSEQDSIGAYHAALFLVDPATAVMTPYYTAGPVGMPSGLACNQNGLIFIKEISNQKLIVLDPLTMATEVRYGTTVSAGDAAFKKSDNSLYYIQRDGGNMLYKSATDPAWLQVVGPLQGGAQLSGLAIAYTPQIQTVDLAVDRIVQPVSNSLTPGAVEVRIYNRGATAITDFQICLATATDTICENWSNWAWPPLPSGTTIDYLFISQVDLSDPGTHCLKAWVQDVQPASDLNPYNDTTFKCIYNAVPGPVQCYPAYIQEAEICGNDDNGGCLSAPQVFVDIQDGESYCGSLWKAGIYRDSDWYRFTLAAQQSVEISVAAGIDLDVVVRSLPCWSGHTAAFKTIQKQQSDSLLLEELPAGQYAIAFVINGNEADVLCNGTNNYSFQFKHAPLTSCKAGAAYPHCDAYISHVSAGVINNSSGTGLVQGYSDYRQHTTAMQTGNSYAILVMNGNPGIPARCGIWADWNRDGDFDDPGESIPAGSGAPGPGPYAAVITPPPSAVAGLTTLRIRVTGDSLLMPCGISQTGEVEDYSVELLIINNPAVTIAGSLSDSCAGVKTVPVMVQDLQNVNHMNLLLNCGSGLTYQSYHSLHPSLGSGSFSLSQNGNQLQMIWFSTTAVTLNNDTLLKLVFQAEPGSHPLSWEQGPGGCSYLSLVQGNLPAIWTDGNISAGSCSTLKGYVKYKNPQNSMFTANVTVKLFSGGLLYASTVLDPADHTYTFSNLPAGVYTVTAETNTAWGGVGSNDALSILRHFTGFDMITDDLKLRAADPNGSAYINATDALACIQRFTGMIPDFGPGSTPPGGPDWIFEAHDILIDGSSNPFSTIRCLCAGDVAPSFYIPPGSIPSGPLLTAPSLYISREGTLPADDTLIRLPVYVAQDIRPGSISLVLDFNEPVEVRKVILPTDPGNLAWTMRNGRLRLGWFSTDAPLLKAGDLLMTLEMRITPEQAETLTLSPGIESEMGDASANIIEGFTLIIPKLLGNQGSNLCSLQVRPNPFRSGIHISYTIAGGEASRIAVVNVAGQVVAAMTESSMEAGRHEVFLDAGILQAGVYFIQLWTGERKRGEARVVKAE